MQTDYLFHGLKGFKNFQRVCYLWDMETDVAQKRLKILKFFDKYGLQATLEAFDISKRTLYRWRALYKNSQGDILSLNPHSKAPRKKRKPQTPQEIIDRVRHLREKYPNIGKAKLYYLLKPWCEENNLPVISESTIGRVIANTKNKMRLTPYRINSKGKIKTKKRVFKNRKPKNLKSKPMHLWAVDTIQRVSDGMKRYIMTLVDPNSRIAFAVAIPTKHSKHTAKVLNALIDGLSDTLTIETKPKSLSILSDNGSEFMKEFDALVKQKGLTHYWTYPRSPKMNAHNERFNRTLQEQFVDYYDDLLFTDIELFNQKMAEWLIDYNTIIPHHSLQMKSPVQYLFENHYECYMWWTNTIHFKASIFNIYFLYHNIQGFKMARLSNMPPINISTEELQRWGEKWLLDRNIDVEEEAHNKLSQLEEDLGNAQTDRKREAIQRKIDTLERQINAGFLKNPNSFDRKQSMNFASFIDMAFGQALAEMLGDIEIIIPSSSALLPEHPDSVEVGPVRIIGGIRPQNYDAAYRPDGPRIVFDSKTLNEANSIRKNWQNMVNDLATEASTVHTRFPYAIVCFMILLPLPALEAKQEHDIIRTLERLATRESVIDQHHLAEAISLIVWDPETGEISTDIPNEGSILRIERFHEIIEPIYYERYKGLPPHDVDIGEEE